MPLAKERDQTSECLAPGKLHCPSFHVVLDPWEPQPCERGHVCQWSSAEAFTDEDRASKSLPHPLCSVLMSTGPIGPRDEQIRFWYHYPRVIQKPLNPTTNTRSTCFICSFIRWTNMHWTCTLCSRPWLQRWPGLWALRQQCSSLPERLA